jgi:crotonobetainyl-CoA:carnitine CoA-transferase CaiB-like acyl-CoA transferase
MTLPLHGVKVLDLTRWLAGPFCTTILGDLGADIAKVEPTGTGDLIRSWGPFDRGISVYYLSVGRNKRSLALNFRDPLGLALVREMALNADVVVENFKPGAMEEMGLGFAELRKDNPRLICARVTGLGSKGPRASWRSVDQIAQGMSGMMSITGADENSPTRMGVPLGDLVAGMWTAIGVQAALAQRQQTGQGQIVETSLLAGLVSLLCVQGQRYLSLGEVPVPIGNDHPSISPYGAFRAKDGLLNVGVANAKMWRDLCVCIGQPQLVDDPRFKTNDLRVANRAALSAALDAAFGARSKGEWIDVLVDAGIPAGPISTMAEVMKDPQVLANGLLESVAHDTLGEIQLIGNPLRFDSNPEGSVRLAPPQLGEHTDAILGDYGLDEERIAQLKTRSVVEAMAR